MYASLHKRFSDSEPLVAPTRYSINSFIVDGIIVGNRAGRLVLRNMNLKLMSSCTVSEYLITENQQSNAPKLYASIKFPDDRDGHYTSVQLLPRVLDHVGGATDGGLCLKTPADRFGFLHAFFKESKQKTISFWFDTSLSAKDINRNIRRRTGEVMFGGVNPIRFFTGTAVRFDLNNLNYRGNYPLGWITKDPVTVNVGSFFSESDYSVIFDIESQVTYLPSEVYDAVVGPLKKVLVDPLTKKPGVDDGILGTIHEFTGEDKKHNYFPCKYTVFLKPFRLNKLLISTEMLFEQPENGQCILRVEPQREEDPNTIVFGFHLIKNFHLAITFNAIYPSYVEFSTRRPIHVISSIANECPIC